MFIIDSHTHVGVHPTQKGTPGEMMHEFKACGVDGLLSCPMTGVMAMDADSLQQGNKEALTLYDSFSDYLYPGVSLHPLFPAESRYALDEFCERNLVWVGELISYRCDIPFDDPRWMDLFRICNARHLIVQLHNVQAVAAVAESFPELTIVGSHLNPDVLPLLADLPNVLIDISGLHGGLCRGTLQKARAMFGAERLLFGSDAPSYDPAPFIMRVKRDFPEEEQHLVFSGNLLRILKQHGVRKIFSKEIP